MTYDEAKDLLNTCNKQAFKYDEGIKVIWSTKSSTSYTVAYGWFDDNDSFIEFYAGPCPSEFSGDIADKLRGCGTPI